MLLLAVLTFSVQLFSQDLSKDYTPITSAGKLPDDFIVSASSKAQKDIEALTKSKSTADKEKARFVISATFFLDNVLKSGKVLYNDPISKYVQKVADNIIANDPKLKDHIRIYVVKSPVVNAYTFDNGVVLVNTGLISQLENEAQLAFVLCHEFVHFKKKHAISAHLEFIKMDKKTTSYNRNGVKLLLEKSKFNKKQETEADVDGLELYHKTAYSYKSIDGLFDVLQFSYLPFDDLEFDKTFFNDTYLKIPHDYFLSKVKDIEFDDDYEDSLHTHPNIHKRRTEVENKIKGKDNFGRVDFVVSEKEFIYVQDLSRFETCRLYMQELEYPEAIYSAYVLLKKYPENIYLKEIIARSLYEVALYKSSYNRYTYTVNYDRGIAMYYKKKEKSDVEYIIDYVDSIQGSSQQVYNILHKMNPMEVSILALHYNWKLNQTQQYSDPNTMAVCDSLMHILVKKHEFTMENIIKAIPPEQKPDTTKKEVVEEVKKNKKESKYDKIRKKPKTKSGKSISNEFVKYAFADYLNDTKFVSMYKAAASEPKEKKKKVTPKTPTKTKPAPKTKPSPKTKPKKKGEEEVEEDEGPGDDEDSVKIDVAEVTDLTAEWNAEALALKSYKALGIDKIVIVDPFYMKMDMRKKEKVSYFSGEDKLKEFHHLLENNAMKLKLEAEILNPSMFEEGDVNKYNDLSFINDWVGERLNHGDFNQALVLSSEYKDELKKRFGTEYFMWTGTVSIREKKRNIGTAIAASILIYSLPWTIPYIILPKYNTYFYSVLFNVETGRIELFSEHELDLKDNEDLLNATIYDTFYQIKSSPKSTSTPVNEKP